MIEKQYVFALFTIEYTIYLYKESVIDNFFAWSSLSGRGFYNSFVEVVAGVGVVIWKKWGGEDIDTKQV